MKSARHLFADITAMLEDLHGVAVEGQAPDLPDPLSRVLAGDIRAGIARIEETATTLEVQIDGAS